MKKAREILLSLSPQAFQTSLSSCYNYPENYRNGSAQAKWHHEGRGVNPPLSLKKPPGTGVEQLVVNLHWSAANVDLIVDGGQHLSHSLIVSKDTKAIIPGDISPVQRPGHSWSKQIQLPHHTWDQSRLNLVTPTTFLFLEKVVNPCSSIEAIDIPVLNVTALHLTRTGQRVTMILWARYSY